MGNGSGGRDPACPQRQHRLVRVVGGLVVVTNVRDRRWGCTQLTAHISLIGVSRDGPFPETTMHLKWITQRLQMGNRTHVPTC